MALPAPVIYSPTGEPLRSVDDVLDELGIEPGVGVRVNNWLLPEELARLEAIRMGRFFLVRNDGAAGERWPCKNHREGQFDKSVFHAYFTYMCIDRPFRGLRDALFAYARARKDDGLERRLLRQLPGLDTLHPFTARDVEPDFSGEQLLGVVLGKAEPIPEWRARLLESAINAKRPPERFVL